jgi:cytidylate kinase
MSSGILIPSIEKRITDFIELTRKAAKELKEKERKHTTITISREFGCDGYPVAEKLKALLEGRTRETWEIMDKALLEETTKKHNLLEGVLSKLGEKSRVLEDVVSTFSPVWKTEHDYYKLLCEQLFALAVVGNVIIVGRGGAIVTQGLDNCLHFRLFGSSRCKMQYMSKRIDLPDAELKALIEKKQKERNKFVRDFLNCDAGELHYYHLVFNCDKTPSEKIAHTIADYAFSK